jgi:hypothetical protein
MNGLAEVIPIAAYRARKKRGAPPPGLIQSVVTAQTRRRRLTIFLSVLAAAVLAMIVMDRTVLPHRAASAPAPLTIEQRHGLYQRALDDVVTSCTLPQAKAGLLRQHCVDQARFLSQLAECTGDCTKLTRGVLGRR